MAPIMSTTPEKYTQNTNATISPNVLPRASVPVPYPT